MLEQDRKLLNMWKCMNQNIWLVITTILSGGIIFVKEYGMLKNRWTDFLIGNSGYRLGISSGINPNMITWTFGFLALLSLFLFATEKKMRYIGVYAIDLIVVFFTGSKNGLLLAIIPLFIYAKVTTFFITLIMQFPSGINK